MKKHLFLLAGLIAFLGSFVQFSTPVGNTISSALAFVTNTPTCNPKKTPACGNQFTPTNTATHTMTPTKTPTPTVTATITPGVVSASGYTINNTPGASKAVTYLNALSTPMILTINNGLGT